MTDAKGRSGPITLLIAALGGEGGGVLTDWIVNAVRGSDLPVQATSIPGVAQRTGATTYYIEIWPEPWGALSGRTPVLSLSPAIGEVDVMVSTEFLEAGRALQGGFITPDRTLLIASTHRVYATTEKIKMGDGRFDTDQLMRAARARARACILFDMEKTARDSGGLLNAVMLGAIAGAGAIPVSADALRDSIRAAGKAVAVNLRGFEAGLAGSGAAIGQGLPMGKRQDPAVDAALLLERVSTEFQETNHVVLRHGVRRLIDYQDAAYASLYLDRLSSFRGAESELFATVARHLAVRMSFEDIFRVAQAKTRPERLTRIRTETGAAPAEPVLITEFFKPGFFEVCDILPERMAGWLLRAAEGRPGLRRIHREMNLRTTTLWGYGRLRMLARLKRWRRGTWRFRREQEAIVDWLQMIEKAAARDAQLALEIAECARLIKGYGDTQRRGLESYRRILTALARPALVNGSDSGAAAAGIARARTAALADAEGEALENELSNHRGQTLQA